MKISSVATSALLLLLSSSNISTVAAERQYSQLVFTKEKCAELGYGDKFDVCAVMEFCEGSRRRRRTKKKKHHHQNRNIVKTSNLRKRRLQDDWWADEDGVEEDEPVYTATATATATTTTTSTTTATTTHTSQGDEEKVHAHEAESKEMAKMHHDHEEHEMAHAQSYQQYQAPHNSIDGSSNYNGIKKQPTTTTTTTTSTTSATISSFHEVEASKFNQEVEQAKEEEAAEKAEEESEEKAKEEEKKEDEEEAKKEAVSNSAPPQQQQEGEDQKKEEDKTAPTAQHFTETTIGDMNVNEAEYGWRLPGQGDCSYPGPVMRLTSGLNHGLIVVKDSSSATRTNLHFHGLHMAGHGNGDDLHRVLQYEEEEIVYGIDLTHGHMGGTHWYHSHVVGKSMEQTKGGAFGMIVVQDNDDVGTNDASVLEFLQNERILIVDDNNNGEWHANGNVGNDDYDYYYDDNGDSNDGYDMETYVFNKDEWYRLRVLMASTNGHSIGGDLKFDEDACEVHAIAHDGILRRQVPKIEAQSEFPLTSSSRLDVAIRCSQDSDISVQRTAVAKISVTSTTTSSTATPFAEGGSPWQSTRMPYAQDMSSLSTVDNTWLIHVYETSINDLGWGRKKPLCSDEGTDFEYGTIQEWTITGADTHPLHVHMYPMQVVGDCGDFHDEGEFYDSIVTAHKSGSSSHHSSSSSSSSSSLHRCKVRVHLIDVAGPTIVHCHIFEHAEHGAMGYLNVVNGPVQPNEPRVHNCPSRGIDACDPVPEPALLCSTPSD